jgi:hypothetical protein
VLQILIRIMEFFCAIDVDNLSGFYKSMLPLARVHNQRNIRYNQYMTGERNRRRRDRRVDEHGGGLVQRGCLV